ncbi:MAG: hypothetical protein ACR2MG_19705 [Pyrinomonadaceae bacterium]
MLTVRGKVENGKVLALEPIDEIYEGNEVTITLPDKSKTNGEPKSTGGIREMFGSVSLGNPTGSDNEQIDADLAREYGSTHEDE